MLERGAEKILHPKKRKRLKARLRDNLHPVTKSSHLKSRVESIFSKLKKWISVNCRYSPSVLCNTKWSSPHPDGRDPRASISSKLFLNQNLPRLCCWCVLLLSMTRGERISCILAIDAGLEAIGSSSSCSRIVREPIDDPHKPKTKIYECRVSKNWTLVTTKGMPNSSFRSSSTALLQFLWTEKEATSVNALGGNHLPTLNTRGSHSPPSQSVLKRVVRETGNDSPTTAAPSSGEASMAWVAAIIINSVLVVIFIAFVVYCYCRSRRKRKQQEASSRVEEWGSSEFLNSGVEEGGPGGRWEDRPPLLAKDRLFTVEGERSRLKDYQQYPERKKTKRKKDRRNDVDRYSQPVSNRTIVLQRSPLCTCSTPECVCNNPSSGRHSAKDGVDDGGESSGYHSNGNNNIRYYNNREKMPGVTQRSRREEIPKGPSLSPRKYLVYLASSSDERPTCVGHVLLPKDTPLTLSQVRGYLVEAESPVRKFTQRRYNFLTESFRVIREQERDSLVDHTYPSKGIIIKVQDEGLKDDLKASNQKEETKYNSPKNSFKRRKPKYLSEVDKVTAMGAQLRLKRELGGNGVCHAPWCDKPARIKCPDCGVTKYCSVHCMRKDKKEHSAVCFKPPWRI